MLTVRRLMCIQSSMAKPKRTMKTTVFNLRMSPQESKEWREAAELTRFGLSQWIRSCCNAVSKEALRQARGGES